MHVIATEKVKLFTNIKARLVRVYTLDLGNSILLYRLKHETKGLLSFIIDIKMTTSSKILVNQLEKHLISVFTRNLIDL